ncbi:hypothetical protein GWK47_004145 [Chionoecetes opilio]|uniref:Ribosomal RNA large subunit methyltransferase K/L-like methyltransferase domain-containing protein n=1 Tax=Chionoecetes opilio TaxID=41210 RepID=A0A8J4YHY2_CHIOP|nr:hypothetical protein GWK47_004145 [Chionoecetes opilio]
MILNVGIILVTHLSGRGENDCDGNNTHGPQVSHVIASDNNRDQLEVARCNLHHLQVPVTLLKADAERLPLQDSSINTVLCDFPFGQKYKLTVEDKQLLGGVLKEMQSGVTTGQSIFTTEGGKIKTPFVVKIALSNGHAAVK